MICPGESHVPSKKTWLFRQCARIHCLFYSLQLPSLVEIMAIVINQYGQASGHSQRTTDRRQLCSWWPCYTSFQKLLRMRFTVWLMWITMWIPIMDIHGL